MQQGPTTACARRKEQRTTEIKDSVHHSWATCLQENFLVSDWVRICFSLFTVCVCVFFFLFIFFLIDLNVNDMQYFMFQNWRYAFTQCDGSLQNKRSK
jgi:hypothetical protein